MEGQLPNWHYGGFVDLGYSLDFNFPENHLFRNRATTPRVNELDLNMAGVYVRKDATTDSADMRVAVTGTGGADTITILENRNTTILGGMGADVLSL